MARLIPFRGNPDRLDAERLIRESHEAVAAGRDIGLMYKSQIADGFAFYRVVESDPLTVEHLPIGDGWQLPAPHIRGLEIEDIRESAAYEKRLSDFVAEHRKRREADEGEGGSPSPA